MLERHLTVLSALMLFGPTALRVESTNVYQCLNGSVDIGSINTNNAKEDENLLGLFIVKDGQRFNLSVASQANTNPATNWKFKPINGNLRGKAVETPLIGNTSRLDIINGYDLGNRRFYSVLRTKRRATESFSGIYTYTSKKRRDQSEDETVVRFLVLVIGQVIRIDQKTCTGTSFANHDYGPCVLTIDQSENRGIKSYNSNLTCQFRPSSTYVVWLYVGSDNRTYFVDGLEETHNYYAQSTLVHVEKQGIYTCIGIDPDTSRTYVGTYQLIRNTSGLPNMTKKEVGMTALKEPFGLWNNKAVLYIPIVIMIVFCGLHWLTIVIEFAYARISSYRQRKHTEDLWAESETNETQCATIEISEMDD